ncbi:MAG: hypothetical protein ACR2O6_05790 [Ilumatobacteraceae bacterium]
MSDSASRSRGFAPRWLRTIEAAAIAGFAHSALALIATAMLLDAPDPGLGDAVVAEFYSDSGNQARMMLAVNLMVVSSIAFLWFVAVIRRRVGERENRFFGTVFLGSALLLTGTWLVAGVLFATPALASRTFETTPDAGTVAVLQSAGLTMASVVATRLEAVFIISTTTVGRLSEAFPRWLVVVGYIVGLTLLLIPVPNVFVTYVFPIWVAAVSATILVRRDQIDLSTT